MEVKNSIIFEIKKDERIYRMEIPGGAPLGETYEACGSFMDKVISLINDHAEKMRPKNIEDLENERKEKDEKND